MFPDLWHIDYFLCYFDIFMEEIMDLPKYLGDDEGEFENGRKR